METSGKQVETSINVEKELETGKKRMETSGKMWKQVETFEYKWPRVPWMQSLMYLFIS